MSAECNLKIIDFNYPFQSNVDITPTTENTEFPASNLKSEIRARAWRSNKGAGHFVIDTTNNKIDFKESGGGPELTATLTQQDYTAITLAAEIKAKLEAAGGEVYTVAISDLTGEWTISTGGSFLSLLFATGTNTAASTGPEIGFLAGDRTGSTSYTGGVKIHSFEAVIFDLKTLEDIDSFAIFFDPRRGLQYSTNAQIRLQANQTLDFSSPSVDVLLTIDEDLKSVSHFFAANQAFRFWRVKIIDPQNSNGFVELPLVVLGFGISFTRDLSNGFKFKKRDFSVVRRNQFGNSYSDKRPKVKRMEWNYSLMPFEDIQVLNQIYERVGKTEPVMISFDSIEKNFDKDFFLLFGKFTTQMELQHRTRTFFNVSLKLEETF